MYNSIIKNYEILESILETIWRHVSRRPNGNFIYYTRGIPPPTWGGG
jgi:hypothetical protein